MRWRFDKWRRRFLPGLISTLAIALLSLLGLLQPVEQLAYQALFLMRGEQAWSDRVVVVQIDDRSLSQIGRFPWNRSQYVNLLKVLTQADASVVAFDFIWSERSDEDAQLAEAIYQHGKVVLACAQDSIGVLLEPVQPLKEVATAIGHIEKQVDVDGIPRSIQAFAKKSPAFAIAALQTDALEQESVTLPQSNQFLWLNWSRPSQRIPSYSFIDVIRAQVPLQAFQKKIVLVGITAVGLDELITPFNRTPPTSGIYLHATLINNFLQGNLLQTIPVPWSVGLLTIAGFSLSACLERWKTSTQVGISLGLAIAWLLLCLFALKFGSVWLPVAAPILLVLSVVSISILQERLNLNAVLQHQVQELWNQYYNDLVLRQIDESRLVTHQLTQQPISMQRVKQLATLAEQFGRSHAAQAAIARNLSLGLLAADLDGFIWFCNPIATIHLTVQIGTLLQSRLVPDWISEQQWKRILQDSTSVTLEVTRANQWFELRFEPLFYQPQDQSPSGLLLILEDITERKQTAIALQTYADTQAELNQRLTERTTQLELVNQELDAFSYAVSHDLRAPLRRIKGFSQLLLEENAKQLDDEGKNYLNLIKLSVQRMRDLIEDLLKLSRIIRSDMELELVDLSQMATAIVQDFQQHSNRVATITVHPNLEICGDARLMRIALENLLSNAWKYTNRRAIAEIEFGRLPASSPHSDIFFIRDNGAGFDMAQADRLFGAFQRLHPNEEFPGIGIGLMTARRIIHRHQGQIWAEAAIDRGATFYFTITRHCDRG